MTERVSLKLSKQEINDLICALYRAIDWSDVEDNASRHGRRWEIRERAFISRCDRLMTKLNKTGKSFIPA